MKKTNMIIDIKIIIPLIFFSIISVISIYSAQSLLSASYNDLYIKQILWYILGFIILILLTKINIEFLYNTSIYLYIIGIIFLILVLFFGTESNGAKCWFMIPGIGSFQPSEFMKIILIFELSCVLSKNNLNLKSRNLKNELYIITKCFIITLIPSILTFLEPDTGIVLIYIVIMFTMLFIYGIRYRWFLLLFIFIGIIIGIFLLLFFIYQNTFISIFGTNFFYRMDRLLDWSKGTGMQLTNAMSASGSAGLFGYGINNTPIYFPEPHTDFIFSVFASDFGFFGCVFLICLIVYFDMQLIKTGIITHLQSKYVISGIISMIIFQQIQNIAMNISLLPITGITLPFISYGGSSLLSYMITIGLILNIKKNSLN